MTKSKLSWAPRLITAGILAQTLFFKFSAAPESVEIFTRLGLEPYGRLGIGFLELVVAILILVPRTAVYGALLGLAIMAGAIMAHFTKLGWSGPMLSLGLLAVTVFLCCLITLYLHRHQLPVINQVLRRKMD